MARNQINLNRFRKVYPQFRKSPEYWIKDSNLREVKEITLTAGTATFTTTVSINAPVAVASPVGSTSNVNVWILGISPNGVYFDITIAASDTSYEGIVHVFVGDSNP
tara:strand:+ start:819 stop:1139 length:321 start_codon:yes stop_codon:yes gene_type:complete